MRVLPWIILIEVSVGGGVVGYLKQFLLSNGAPDLESTLELSPYLQ